MPADPDELELQRNYDRMTDRRLTILETRFDTILPLLATKADLAELKAEMKAEIRVECAKVKTDLTRWMAGIVLSLVLGFGGVFVTMVSLFQR